MPQDRRREVPDGLVRGALMLLISVVGLPGLQNELGNLDGVEIMLKRFADSRAGANMRNDAVMILAKLCENHEDNQARLRRAHGVSLLIQEIDAYVKRRAGLDRATRICQRRRATPCRRPPPPRRSIH